MYRTRRTAHTQRRGPKRCESAWLPGVRELRACTAHGAIPSEHADEHREERRRVAAQNLASADSPNAPLSTL